LEDNSFYNYLKKNKKLPRSKGFEQKKTPTVFFASNKLSSHKISLANVKLKSKLKNPPSNTNKKELKPWFLDFKFLFTSLFIFLVSQVFLNFSAYKDFIHVKYMQVFNIENSLQTTAFKARQEPIKESFIEGSNQTQSIPLYDFEIVPTDFRIIIPTLNINVPIKEVPKNNLFLRDWKNLEKDIQNSLQDGVIHYPGTPSPNLSGNFVVTGHSSYYPWSIGRYKDVFAVLHNSKLDDLIYVYHNQRKYVYQVTDIQSVYPEDIEVLADMGDNRITLITCTPLGTNIKRLIVSAVPVEI
jgi:LPXTG-site transpeptidase (sortase) family protein